MILARTTYVCCAVRLEMKLLGKEVDLEEKSRLERRKLLARDAVLFQPVLQYDILQYIFFVIVEGEVAPPRP